LTLPIGLGIACLYFIVVIHCTVSIVAIGNPERHVRKASDRGSKQQ